LQCVCTLPQHPLHCVRIVGWSCTCNFALEGHALTLSVAQEVPVRVMHTTWLHSDGLEKGGGNLRPGTAWVALARLVL
jgi:hypothetical protein